MQSGGPFDIIWAQSNSPLSRVSERVSSMTSHQPALQGGTANSDKEAPYENRRGAPCGVPRFFIAPKRKENIIMSKRVFTSESVTEGHPDKICDQISDAVLDAILEKDPMGRVACETTVTTGLVHVMGEITTHCYVDIPKVAREVIREIGYDRAKYGRSAMTGPSMALTATPAPSSPPLTSSPATLPWAWTRRWRPSPALWMTGWTTAPETRA